LLAYRGVPSHLARYRRPDPYALRPAHTTFQPPPQIGEPAIVPDDPRHHPLDAPRPHAGRRRTVAIGLRRGCELRQPCQTGRMALHFPSDTTYRVVLRRDRTYGVEVSKPKSTPFIVNGFRTEVEADGWIKFQRLRTKERDAWRKSCPGRRHDGTAATRRDCSKNEKQQNRGRHQIENLPGTTELGTSVCLQGGFYGSL